MVTLHSNEHSLSKLHSVVGYGTFITKGHWKHKQDVEVCLVHGFKRIFPCGTWFPYILPHDSSFWALKFNVNEEQLEELDQYEGVHSGLFKRIKIDVILSNGNKIPSCIYVPTEKTITSQHLGIEIDPDDCWKDEIKKYPEIIEKFPQLVL